LALIPRHWPTALPHLIKYLESIKEVSGWESRHLVELFGSLGTNARPAMPILLTMLDYPDTSVREALTNALPRIDPEAAAKAGLNRR